MTLHLCSQGEQTEVIASRRSRPVFPDVTVGFGFLKQEGGVVRPSCIPIRRQKHFVVSITQYLIIASVLFRLVHERKD